MTGNALSRGDVQALSRMPIAEFETKMACMGISYRMTDDGQQAIYIREYFRVEESNGRKDTGTATPRQRDERQMKIHKPTVPARSTGKELIL